MQKPLLSERFYKMVPLKRIGLSTPSLPMTCSTTELQRHNSYSIHNLYNDGVQPRLVVIGSLRSVTLSLLAGRLRALQTKTTFRGCFCLAATNDVLYHCAIMAMSKPKMHHIRISDKPQHTQLFKNCKKIFLKNVKFMQNFYFCAVK